MREVRSSWPRFDDDERAAAAEVLASGKVNYWTGEHGRAFEEEFASYHGSTHAIALANGTLALEGALLALGIGPGDEVVVPARTFIATASCVVARGGRPVVADCDEDSGNVTAETIEAVMTPATKAVIVVHLGGWPCEMEPIVELCRARGVALVEDCAQAHGAEVRGRKVGTFGEVAAFSFCQDKIITTAGDGGMVITDDDRLARAIVMYKDHGKDPVAMAAPAESPAFKWLHTDFGSNWRLTEVQSAIGRIQLGKLDGWVARRAANAGVLAAELALAPALRVPLPPDHMKCAWYKLHAFVRPERLASGWSRDRILVECQDRNLPVFGGSCSEIYRERAFVDRGWGLEAPLPVARALGETSLMFQVDPTLDEDDMRVVGGGVREVLEGATSS